MPPPNASPSAEALRIQNGWFVHNGRVVWGYAQHNGWWRPGQRPNITRNAPGDVRPNRTEDLDKLTDNMLRYGYPGFEHNFGLWYDRRRDRHDTARRTDSAVVAPFLEQPWARSGNGRAWDGLTKYDLMQYNPWYFNRLKKFAELCDHKGTILFHNFYMQHAFLETDAHYLDSPWRPVNCIQKTAMPDHIPAANAFYDITHPTRRRLHRAYIRKCLDELGDNTDVVFLVSEEYTGPLSFMRFSLDTVFEWEREKGKVVHVAASGCKDVLDAILSDPVRSPKISTIDLRYWWYLPDGSLYAPTGGREFPGRYTGKSKETSAQQIYRQVKEYRLRYPDKAIVHMIEASRQQTWAFLMGGGSMLIRDLEYPGGQDPPEYIPPADSHIIQPTYDFIRANLATTLQRMKPQNLLRSSPERNWCLAETNKTYLVYALKGGRIQLDLSAASGRFTSKWFNPRTGQLSDANGGFVAAGKTVTFNAPDRSDWALWLSARAGR